MDGTWAGMTRKFYKILDSSTCRLLRFSSRTFNWRKNKLIYIAIIQVDNLWVCGIYYLASAPLSYYKDFQHFFPRDMWNILMLEAYTGAHGSVVGWVSDEVDFFNLSNSSSHTMALRTTKPLKKMSTRNLPGDKKRPARRADNLVTICEPNVWKCGSLNLLKP
jgi:hypothetical protein